MPFKCSGYSFTLRLVLLSLIILIAACKKSEKPSANLFASPEDAGSTLLSAAKLDDQNALISIFGPDSKEIIFSGDAVQDKSVAEAFATGYGVMHRWRAMPDGTQILLVGADNFPFPIPLKQNSGGRWFFDTAAGKEEILSRRVGRNELAVIDISAHIADAQEEYFSQAHDGDATRQYATKFISDPGKQNGLYWKVSQGQPESPLGPLAESASAEGYTADSNAHAAFHGYYFRMLKGQGRNAPGGAKDYVVDGKMTGGFAFAAYPAEYGNSGVMTFMMDQDGVLLQKNLGKNTAEVAKAMSQFDPDASWHAVEQQ
jgi:Protein of unknown function (DUF2950)